METNVEGRALRTLGRVPAEAGSDLRLSIDLDLQPGEEKELNIHLPLKAFGLYDEDGRCVVNPGLFRIYVGTCGPDRRSLELCGGTMNVLEVSSTAETVVE